MKEPDGRESWIVKDTLREAVKHRSRSKKCRQLRTVVEALNPSTIKADVGVTATVGTSSSFIKVPKVTCVTRALPGTKPAG